MEKRGCLLAVSDLNNVVSGHFSRGLPRKGRVDLVPHRIRR